jgi:hypothetical protein
MGRSPTVPSHPSRYYSLLLRLKGSQKQTILEYARAHGLSMNQLILYSVLRFIDEKQGIPQPGPSQYSLVEEKYKIQSLLDGEQLLTPCGKTRCKMVLEDIDGLQFCTTCNIRVL